MPNISRKDLERLAIGFGIADFLTEGRLSAPIARGTKAALRKAAPAIGRGLLKYGPRVAVTAARVTPTPIAAAATGAAIIQNREAIANLARQGFEVVEPVAQRGFETAIDYGQGVVERAMDPASFRPPTQRDFLGLRTARPKKKTSKFNKAIRAGMLAAKASTSYGAKGKINNAKKAFSAVTKTASKINKGGKVAKKGALRKIGLAIKKVLR